MNRINVIGIIILSMALALAVQLINANKMPFAELADGQRYADMLATNNFWARPTLAILYPFLGAGQYFPLIVNFFIYLALTLIIFNYTNRILPTLTIALGFSVTLMTTFNLYAQAMVIIAGLYFWLYITVEKKNWLYWLAFAAFGLFTHSLGLPFVLLLVWAKMPNLRIDIWNGIKVEESNINLLKWITIAIFILTSVIIMGMDKPLRMTFYYPTILPIDLGTFNTYLWIFFLTVPIMYIFCKTTNPNAYILVSSLFAACGLNIFFGSGLEIDYFRILIFAELVMLLQIWKEDTNHKATWLFFYLTVIGVARIFAGVFF